MNICVLAESESEFEKSQELAQCLSATLLPDFFDVAKWKQDYKRLKSCIIGFDAALLVHRHGLSLLPLIKLMSPVFIDFSNTAWARRLFNISSKKELAAKAIGIGKHQSKPHVFDANAGLGQDSFVFAALGAKVLACERSLLIYLLLKDALQRAAQDPNLVDIVKRITLVHEDSRCYLTKHPNLQVDVIFLDPMFPEKKNQALAKKEMQAFQGIFGADDDAQELFDLALTQLKSANTVKRLVLKRPKLASVLNESVLSRQLQGNATRFDIYFKS